MKQNFKLKEVLEFGLKVREATAQSNVGGNQLIYDDWDKFCEKALTKKPIDLSGINNRAAKLTLEQVKEIKQQLNKGRSTTIIAANFKVTKYCINNIKYNRTWKDVTN